jgi:hypothetical protein
MRCRADLGEVQAGPPACGGECGACAASGLVQIMLSVRVVFAIQWLVSV